LGSVSRQRFTRVVRDPSSVSMKSSMRSRLTGCPLIWSSPSIIWMVSPGNPITRLI
jgi:hypothetical protein